MNIKRKLLVISLFSITISSFFASEPLPNGYKNIQLGMNLDETKSELIKNPDFGYRGDRDVSLIPGDNRILIETDTASKHKLSYFTQCWFQFYNETLYTIILNINTSKMDYYTMFTTLKDKYGEPSDLDPQKALWKNEDITLILEKPLSIKYIDNKTVNEISNASNIQKSAEENSRQMFLDEF